MKQEKDAALETALDELRRLSSPPTPAPTFDEYSERLLTSKAKIEVALQRTTDDRAKRKIENAVTLYVEARNEWRKKQDDKDYAGFGDGVLWNQAAAATRHASEYAFADEAVRQKLDDLEEQETKTWNEAKAKEAEAVQREREAEQKRMAEAAEQERKRRFAPEGTVFNLKVLSIVGNEGVTSVPPGTELMVTKKNPDGTLHVQKGDLAADVSASVVTNDRDLVATLRSDDKKKQEALRQWKAQQAQDATRQQQMQTEQSAQQQAELAEKKASAEQARIARIAQVRAEIDSLRAHDSAVRGNPNEARIRALQAELGRLGVGGSALE